MKSVRKRFFTTVWYCCLIGVITVGLVFIAGCSDSDDDGGGSDTLPVYNFTIDMDPVEVNGVLAEPQAIPMLSPKPGPLVVSYTDYVLELSGVLYGSIDTRDNGYTIFDVGPDEASTIAKAEVFEELENLFGLLTLDVTVDIVIPDDAPPTAGAWTVQSVDPVETVTVTVVTSPTPGVEIQSSVVGGDPVPFTWGAFEALLENDANPDWQRKAGASGSVIRFLVENTFFITETFDIIGDLEDVLEDGVPVVEWCSAFPEDQNPMGVLQEGYNEFTWYDVNDNDVVGGGDSFEWFFYDCWDDDPEDDIDDLFRGGMYLLGYTDSEEGGVTTRIGYETPVEGPGGVYFKDFCLSEIEEDEGVYTHDSEYALTLNGGFTIVFYEPVD
jgi:hypothetical protein